MEKKIVLFNAPKNVGKDMICDFLVGEFENSEKFEFKKHLVRLCKIIYSISDDDWDKYSSREYKEVKMFNGKSIRDILIEVSEEVIKPKYGRDYFGILTGKDIENSGSEYFFGSDCGFYEEVEAAAMDVVTSQVPLLFRIFKDGHDFSGDSRGYIDKEKASKFFKVVDIENVHGKMGEFQQTVLRIVKNHFGD